MNDEYIRTWLTSKFTEIESRLLLVLDQLSDEQVNWIPNNTSNSISNLIIHIDGNISERISKGIHYKPFKRDREKEFDTTFITMNKERSNIEILLQCATHFSEHMGQILYIAKICLDDSYETT
jgi:hypothetical protein